MNDGISRTNPWNLIRNIRGIWIVMFSSQEKQNGFFFYLAWKTRDLELIAHFHEKKKTSHEVGVQESKYALKYLICLVVFC